MNTQLLSNSDVSKLLDIDDIVRSVENAYCDYSRGLVVQPDILTIYEPGTDKGYDFKVGLDLGAGYYSMKSSSSGYVDNPKKGLPTGLNVVYLYDAQTSALECIMEGAYIRNLRTAAAAAIAVKYLSRADAHTYFAYGARPDRPGRPADHGQTASPHGRLRLRLHGRGDRSLYPGYVQRVPQPGVPRMAPLLKRAQETRISSSR